MDVMKQKEIFDRLLRETGAPRNLVFTVLQGLTEAERVTSVLANPRIKEQVARTLIESLKGTLTEEDVRQKHEDIRAIIREKFAELEKKLAELGKKVDKVEEELVEHHDKVIDGIDELGGGQVKLAKSLGKIEGYQEVILDKIDYSMEEIKSKIEDEGYRVRKKIDEKGNEVVDKFYDRIYDLERDLSRF